MDKQSAQVFLPPRERCFSHLRLARFGETVTCVHCESDEVVKQGTTGKDAQQYRCKACETYFNERRFSGQTTSSIVRIATSVAHPLSVASTNRVRDHEKGR